MPGFDGTGPWGEGPMTGRALGVCAGGPYAGGYGRGPGFGRGRGFGRGLGGGRGFGRGRGPGWGRGLGFRGGFGPAWGAYPPVPSYGPYGYGVSQAEEKAMLEDELNFIKGRMEEISQRINELESASEE